MINGKLQEFVCNVAVKGRISYGDVRRLQRDYLPGGITNCEELELVTSANTKLIRADKAWTQWLVASVLEFIAKQVVREHPSKEAAGEWVGRLLAASSTSVGRKIARKVRCELARQHGIQSTELDQHHPGGIRTRNVPQPSHAEPLDTSRDAFSLRGAGPSCCGREARSARSRPAVRRRKNPGAMAFAAATHGLFLADYLPAVQHGHLINFHSARIAPALAPCR